MASWDKIKVGNLYLYTMDPSADRHGRYVDVPVIALKRNENTYGFIEGNDEYPTWVCLFPNLTTGGLYPRCLTDITLIDDEKK